MCQKHFCGGCLKISLSKHEKDRKLGNGNTHDLGENVIDADTNKRLCVSELVDTWFPKFKTLVGRVLIDDP